MNSWLRRIALSAVPLRDTTRADAVVLVAVGVLIYVGAEFAARAPEVINGPRVSLSPAALPFYALLSVSRMAAAYVLSLSFALIYGYAAARNRSVERVLMPLLDVLQSVPILSFLPVVLLGLTAIMPESLAAELASVVLIFTSQAWNIAFAWYQSLTTVPAELREATSVFRFNTWFRLRNLELPFGAISLIWNSMMSWAGGWFFLMAAEMFTVGNRDFRLPGLGAYLQTAADRGDVGAVCRGVATLVLVIVALDQLVWRPLLVWADRFKMEMVAGEAAPRSWFYGVLRNSALIAWFGSRIVQPLGDRLDAWTLSRFSVGNVPDTARRRFSPGAIVLTAVLIALGYGAVRSAAMLARVSPHAWGDVAVGLGATLLRVAVSMLIALAWTVPLGVAVATNRRLADWLQPVVQITAAVPATALFPVLLLVLINMPGGLNVAAVLLMLMGTQWYLLFNVLAGASAIPQDLRYTARLLGLSRLARWRTLILPALFPYIITGAITASGGAWNASIVAEYAQFGGRTVFTTGIGSTIARATAAGDFPLLLAATLAMILTVVVINRVFWRRLYRLAEERYRIEG